MEFIMCSMNCRKLWTKVCWNDFPFLFETVFCKRIVFGQEFDWEATVFYTKKSNDGSPSSPEFIAVSFWPPYLYSLDSVSVRQLLIGFLVLSLQIRVSANLLPIRISVLTVHCVGHILQAAIWIEFNIPLRRLVGYAYVYIWIQYANNVYDGHALYRHNYVHRIRIDRHKNHI